MAIDIFDILFLPMLLFIGLITSYEDIKYGKVRNKWLRLGLIWGILIIVFLYLWYPIASPVSRFFYFEILGRAADSVAPVFTVSLAYLNKVVLNAGVSLALAYLMWKGGAWAAGDAKLFFIYALLLPLKYYWKSFLPVFPSFALMVNIFIPIFAYLLFRSFFFNTKYFYQSLRGKRIKEQKDKRAPEQKSRGKWGKIKPKLVMVITFIALFMFINLFQEPIKNQTSIDIISFQAFIFAAIIIFGSSLRKVFDKTISFWLALGILASLLSYGLATSPVATWQTFYQSVLTMAVFMTLWTILRKMVDFHVLKTCAVEIDIDTLEPRMNIDENVLSEIKKDKEDKDKLGVLYPDGLTEKQVAVVREFLEQKKKTKIKIYQPFPFVLWMFIGVMITLILKSSLFHLFIKIGTGD